LSPFCFLVHKGIGIVFFVGLRVFLCCPFFVAPLGFSRLAAPFVFLLDPIF